MNSRTTYASVSLLQTGLRRAHQDAAAVLAADDGVRRGLADVVDVGDRQLLAAALAGALVQLGRADAALLVAQLVVELEEVRGDRPRDDLALLRHRRHLAVDLLERGVPARGRVVDLALDGTDPLGQLGDPRLRGLPALHDVQDDVLQVALPLGEGGDLALEVLQVLRGGDRARVQALLVAD